MAKQLYQAEAKRSGKIERANGIVSHELELLSAHATFEAFS